MRSGLVVFFVFAAFTRIIPSLPNKVTTASEITLSNYYQSVAEYFKASQKEIRLVKESNLSDEEIPVVYFIARSAKTSIEDVTNMRLCGLRWIDIVKYYDLDPKSFSKIDCDQTVSCSKHAAMASEKKIYKKRNPKVYSDQQIQNLVNIKFISEDHLCSPAYIRKLKKGGSDFVSINDQIIQEHREHLEELRSKNIESIRISGIQN